MVKDKFAGGIPFARAVAKAIANRPQSQPPACIWTFMIFNLIDFFFVHRIAATSFLVYVPTDGYILSYTYTSAPFSAPTVLTANVRGHRAKFAQILLTEYQTHMSDRDREVETHQPWDSASLVVIEQQI